MIEILEIEETDDMIVVYLYNGSFTSIEKEKFNHWYLQGNFDFACDNNIRSTEDLKIFDIEIYVNKRREFCKQFYNERK